MSGNGAGSVPTSRHMHSRCICLLDNTVRGYAPQDAANFARGGISGGALPRVACDSVRGERSFEKMSSGDSRKHVVPNISENGSI
jgi:hypothetical protein